MPELPEVEATRRKLSPHLVGRRVARIEHDDPARYVGTTQAHGRVISALGRRGKYLIASLSGVPPLELIIHLGMTGGFRPQASPHTRVILHLEGGVSLYFQDARRFGTWRVVGIGSYAGLPTLAGMGPEPLGDEFREADFVRAAAGAGAVKPWLLSQVPVAGLGNIYTDEALWRARIHPAQAKLSSAQARRLYRAIRQVLRDAVEAGGSTLSDATYAQPDGEPGRFQARHRVYGREGLACTRCGDTIQKTVLGQRGTHHCPSCQMLVNGR